jgi:hypothetical protein
MKIPQETVVRQWLQRLISGTVKRLGGDLGSCSATLLANVDAWVDGQISDRLTRPAAICCLIEERP